MLKHVEHDLKQLKALHSSKTRGGRAPPTLIGFLVVLGTCTGTSSKYSKTLRRGGGHMFRAVTNL